MKHLLLLLIAIAPVSVFGQVFYVEPTTFEYERKIYEQLRYDGFKLTDKVEESDYTVECFATTGKPFKGYVKISDTKTGALVTRSKEIITSAYNPKHAGNKIMGRITAGNTWKKLMAPIKARQNSSGEK